MKHHAVLWLFFWVLIWKYIRVCHYFCVPACPSLLVPACGMEKRSGNERVGSTTKRNCKSANHWRSTVSSQLFLLGQHGPWYGDDVEYELYYYVLLLLLLCVNNWNRQDRSAGRQLGQEAARWGHAGGVMPSSAGAFHSQKGMRNGWSAMLPINIIDTFHRLSWGVMIISYHLT